MPSTPLHRPELPECEEVDPIRSRSSEFLRTPSGSAGKKGLLGEVVVKGVAGGGRGEDCGVCFMLTSPERVTAVTDSGQALVPRVFQRVLFQWMPWSWSWSWFWRIRRSTCWELAAPRQIARDALGLTSCGVLAGPELGAGCAAQ